MRSTQLCWRSAVDSPHGLLLSLAIAIPLVLTCLAWITAADALYIFVAMLVAGVLIGWPSYKFEPETLVIRSGVLLRWRLPYDRIQSASPCTDWRIAVAMSRRRIRVEMQPLGRGRSRVYWISPKNRPAFLSMLRSRIKA